MYFRGYSPKSIATASLPHPPIASSMTGRSLNSGLSTRSRSMQASKTDTYGWLSGVIIKSMSCPKTALKYRLYIAENSLHCSSVATSRLTLMVDCLTLVDQPSSSGSVSSSPDKGGGLSLTIALFMH